MSFVFMVFHYPAAEHRDELIRSMREMATHMSRHAGFIDAGPWSDERHPERIIGLSRWSSRDAFLASGITVAPDSDEVPEGEVRPRERFFLDQAHPGS
ncbi:MAG TPA: antibiotic biosynthesis monooxygenase [Candidatus Limnocylindria bacterium]|nr:antibiotic biosynthesis monooxygenase [Candidatus Limnocylindria bacterium]